jgi:hypothetical protein
MQASSVHIHGDSGANQLSTFHVMKAVRQSPVCILDVSSESCLFYLHHEGAYFIAKCLRNGKSKALLTSQM